MSPARTLYDVQVWSRGRFGGTMAHMSVSWEDVVAQASTLPEVTESTSYGTPAIKVAGKLMGRLRTESEGALALRCSTEDKQALVAGPDPAFFTIPHYDGYDYVLVDLDRVDPDELSELIDDAWYIVAPPKIRKARLADDADQA